MGNRAQGKDSCARWDAPGLGDAAHPLTSQHVLHMEGMANHDALKDAQELQ